jgi:protein-disulfide isomerase
MNPKKTVQQIFILSMTCVSLALMGCAVIYRQHLASQPVPIMVMDGHPSIGSRDAKIGMLLIEDFRCYACQSFIDEVFPTVRKKYIDTGVAYCIVVPVAFLDGSKPLANAALAVFKIAPTRFFPYVHAIFKHFGLREIHGSERNELVKIAEAVGGIDLEALQKCVESNCYFTELDRNLDWAERIMGKGFGVPALFINGVPTSTASVDAISGRIEKMKRSL